MIPRWTLIFLLAGIMSITPGTSKRRFPRFNYNTLMIPNKRIKPEPASTVSTTSTSTTTTDLELYSDERQYIKSITSLEGLMLEAIERAGTEVCLSSFAQTVMQGTWRNNTVPSREEMADSNKLKEVCRNSPKAAPSFYKGPVKSPKQPPSTNNNVGDEFTYHLLPTQIAGRAGGVEPPVDAETMNKINGHLKDRSADCKPRKIPVEIPSEPQTTFIPKCTLVERCGGCCNHDSLKCVPTAKNGISFKKMEVAVLDSTGKVIKVKQVSIEKHNKCNCVCKVQKTDCNDAQDYDSRNCRCLCKNKKPKCEAPLYWDQRSCKCRCSDQTVTECSTGSYFASHLCRCVTADEIMEDESKRSRRF